jgi:hypothetical protein
MRRRYAEVDLEHALQMALRKLHETRQLFERQRLFDIRFHQPHHFDQLGARKPHPRVDRNRLRIAGATNPLENELFGYLSSEVLSQAAFHQIQHQIERCGAARAGQAVTIDDK